MSTNKGRVARLEAARGPEPTERITEIHLVPLLHDGEAYTGPPLAVLHIGPRPGERRKGAR